MGFADNEDSKEFMAATNYKTDSVYGFGHTAYYNNVLGTMLHGKVAQQMEEGQVAGIANCCVHFAKSNQTISCHWNIK